MCPQPFLPLPCLESDDNGGEPVGFIKGRVANGEWRMAFPIRYLPPTRYSRSFWPKSRHIWPVFGALCLDSGPLAGYKSCQPGAGFSRAVCFCAALGIASRPRGIRDDLMIAREPITTEEKAGPDLSEAGIEHEGIKRCSQSSKPAAGNTASFRMMCSR